MVSVPAILEATLRSFARNTPQMRVLEAAKTLHKTAFASDRLVLSPPLSCPHFTCGYRHSE